MRECRAHPFAAVTSCTATCCRESSARSTSSTLQEAKQTSSEWNAHRGRAEHGHVAKAARNAPCKPAQAHSMHASQRAHCTAHIRGADGARARTLGRQHRGGALGVGVRLLQLLCRASVTPMNTSTAASNMTQAGTHANAAAARGAALLAAVGRHDLEQTRGARWVAGAWLVRGLKV